MAGAVRVLLFGPLAEAAGVRQLSLPVRAGERLGELWARLLTEHPALRPWDGRVALAVNLEYGGPERVLAPGDEVAVLPPVSGGAEAAEGAAASGAAASGPAGERVRLTEAPLDVGAVLAAVRGDDAGAVVLFVGTVRAVTAGRRTRELQYEAYVPMALRELERLADEVAARWPGVRLAVHHRLGRLEPGEVATVIAAAAPHRDAAFAACRLALEELKRRVPIWKRERYEDGEVWVGRDGTHPLAVPSRGEAGAPTGPRPRPATPAP